MDEESRVTAALNRLDPFSLYGAGGFRHRTAGQAETWLTAHGTEKSE